MTERSAEGQRDRLLVAFRRLLEEAELASLPIMEGDPPLNSHLLRVCEQGRKMLDEVDTEVWG